MDDPTSVELTAIKRTHMTDGTLEQGTLLPVTVSHADLNDDHRPDIIYRSANHVGCGSLGCGTWALLATPTGYAPTSIDLAVSGGVASLRGICDGLISFSDEGTLLVSSTITQKDLAKMGVKAGAHLATQFNARNTSTGIGSCWLGATRSTK